MASNRAPPAPLDRDRAARLFGEVLALQKAERLADSAPLIDELIAMGISTPGILHLQARAARAAGHLERARTIIEQALRLDPNDASAMVTYGIILTEYGLQKFAVIVLEKAIARAPNDADAFANLGRAHMELGEAAKTEQALRRALELAPTSVQAGRDYVQFLRLQQRHDDALAYLDERQKKAGFEGDFAVARIGIFYMAQRFDAFRQAIDALPSDKLTIRQQARVKQLEAGYCDLSGQYEAGLAIINAWQDRECDDPFDWYELRGLIAYHSGQYEAGKEALRALLAPSPDKHEARTYLGMMEITTGQYRQGFANYEARWLCPNFPTHKRRFDAPRWTGEPISGKRLLVWLEQGIGDEVRDSSFIPDILAEGADLTLECAAKLVPLFARSFPRAHVRERGPVICTNDPDYASFDYQIPGASLAPVVRPEIADFERRQKPWLFRDWEREAETRRRLGLQPHQKLIGLCWRSSWMSPDRARDCLTAEDLLPFKDVTDAVFLNLQYSGSDEEVAMMQAHGFDIRHFPDIDQKDDLPAACGLIGACDLIVTAGVSVCDLGAALGRPVLRFSSCKEQNALGLTDGRFPYYPTLRHETLPADPAAYVPGLIGRLGEVLHWAAAIERTFPPANAPQP